MIKKTQHLVEIARRDNYNPPCYYLRGLQPQANTTPTIEPYFGACIIGAGSSISHWAGPPHIYTNGSGGSQNSDPRLRRCGWAWIINSQNGDYQSAPVAHDGEYGRMEGKQTVP
eukprot:7190835-Karenia_brevis.AAC.1